MEEKENARAEKRWTCDNIKCPCMKAARRLKPRPTVGKGKHEKVWFTDELVQEVGWDPHEKTYKDCCHYQVDDRGFWIVGSKTVGEGPKPPPPGNPFKALFIILGVIAAVLIGFAIFGGGGGGEDKDNTNANEAAAVEELSGVLERTFHFMNEEKPKS